MPGSHIFVSHASADSEFCSALVANLRAAGAEVWYDQENLGAGQLLDTITQEIVARKVFIVVLSQAAFKSQWVRQECQWAFNLASREPDRFILPVVAQPIAQQDFNDLLFLEGFLRIEAPGFQPYPRDGAIARVLAVLGLKDKETGAAPAVPADLSTRGLIARGKALLAQGEFAEALPFFTHATEQSRRSHVAWFSLGYAYGNLTRYKEAHDAFERAIALRPDYAHYWYNKGLCQNYLNRYAEALPTLEECLRLDPDYAPAWTEKALALSELSRHEEAVAACETALTLDPHFALAWERKGDALRDLGRRDEAISAYDQALALEGPSVVPLYDKAHLLADIGRNEEALAVYDQALALDPNDPLTWNSKAHLYMKLGRHEVALQFADRALALSPNDARFWGTRGMACLELGQYRDALDAFNRSASLDPTLSDSQEFRSIALRKLGREGEAQEAEARLRALRSESAHGGAPRPLGQRDN